MESIVSYKELNIHQRINFKFNMFKGEIFKIKRVKDIRQVRIIKTKTL